MPDVYFAKFSTKRLEIIDVVWTALVNGAWKNVEAYRGFGKTSLLSGLLFKTFCRDVICRAIYVAAEEGASVAQTANGSTPGSPPGFAAPGIASTTSPR